MVRSLEDSAPQGMQTGTAPKTQAQKLTSIDPYSLLGIGAALALYDSEEDVAQFIASAVTAALRVKFGAVALREAGDDKLRVLGQLSNSPLQISLVKEIEKVFSTSIKNANAGPGETIREIEVKKELFPKLHTKGLGRLLLVPLRTLDRDFGFVLGGKTSYQPYLPVQTASLDTLASQTSMALHRIQLNKERKRAEQALQEAHDELEHRVEERTAELAKANTMLKAEITERKQSEVALEHLRQQNELLLNSVGEGIYGLDLHGNTTFANPASARMLGWTAEELIGKPQHAIIHHTKSDGKPYPREECPIYAAFKDGVVHRVDTEVFWRKDGTSFPVEYISTPIRDDDNNLVGAVVTFRDITERKQAEKELRESRARFSGILDIAREAIISTDESKHIIMFNKGAEKIFNYSQDEVIGKSIDHLIPEKFHKAHHSHIAEFAGSALTSHLIGERREIFGRRKNGEIFPAEASISKLQLDGQLILTAILRDITKRKQAETVLRNALNEVQQLKDRLQAENVYLQEEIKLVHNFDEIISTSKSFKKVLRNVEQVAVTDATVLILGETGTGKELIARALHTTSLRKERPLVKVNCAALPENLIESELFGHEKGAFTGAFSRKQGRFELADRGTIFLDEIGDLPLDLQAKLLRVLQEGEFERVGGTQTIKVDVRVIAATNRNLEESTRSGTFREDLFYRLNVFPITLPPLRERAEDIPLLVNHFIKKYQGKLGKKISRVPQKVMKTLQTYHFPGNIRELENIIERAIILARDETLQVDESLELLKSPAAPAENEGTLAEIERSHIVSVLEETNWRIEGQKGAALRLGINANTLRSRMQKLGIMRPATGTISEL
ncbi:sigma 54-interacting transcriptional regulator [candidate division KSB1 bacterium]|nr:sigma 54-interacting transcriptional regulator [candidate division KSB1 bacterium]